MPSLRRRRQLYAFLVAPCLAAVRTSSTITVYNQNRTTGVPTEFADQPAHDGFGPKVPDEVGGGGFSQHSVLVKGPKKWRQVVSNRRYQFLCNRMMHVAADLSSLRSLLVSIVVCSSSTIRRFACVRKCKDCLVIGLNTETILTFPDMTVCLLPDRC